MPQMSPLLWESFILLGWVSLILMACYFNFFFFHGKTRVSSLKVKNLKYKW